MTSPVLIPAATLTTTAGSVGPSAPVAAVRPISGTAVTERADTAQAMAAIVSELGPRFAGQVPREVIVQCVDQAVRDLHESICRDALPEMAVRLATVRLDRRIQQENEAEDRTASA